MQYQLFHTADISKQFVKHAEPDADHGLDVSYLKASRHAMSHSEVSYKGLCSNVAVSAAVKCDICRYAGGSFCLAAMLVNHLNKGDVMADRNKEEDALHGRAPGCS